MRRKDKRMKTFFFNEKGESTAALKWLFLLSATVLSGLLSVKGEVVWIAVSVVCAAAVLCLLVFRFRFLEHIFPSLSRKRAVLSGILAAYAAYWYASVFYDRLYRVAEELGSRRAAELIGRFGAAFSIVAGILSVLALFAYLYWFIGWFAGRMRRLAQGSDSVERWFLIGAMAAAILVIVLVYRQTTVFYSPNGDADNVWDKIDIVYSSDTASLVEQNVFLNVAAAENDIRQPLFGVFAAPFALCASLLARLTFLPNAYCVLLQIVQALLMMLSLIMLSRMLRLYGFEKALFLALIGVSYPTLLFLLNIEQYIFPVFWMTLLIWQYVTQNGDGRECAWIAASGSMLTSGVLILLVPPDGSPGERVRAGLLAILKFAAVVLLFGRAAMVLSSAESVRFLLQFAGEKLPLTERLMQYANFVSACFAAPAAEIVQYSSELTVFHQSAATGWNAAGVVLFAAAAAGFFTNRKNVFAKICFGWVAFSFLLLCLVGWGTSENGLVLYTLYFSWAFVSLIVLLVRRVFEKFYALRCAVLSAGALAMLVLNVQGISEIVRFGLQYYPAK